MDASTKKYLSDLSWHLIELLARPDVCPQRKAVTQAFLRTLTEYEIAMIRAQQLVSTTTQTSSVEQERRAMEAQTAAKKPDRRTTAEHMKDKVELARHMGLDDPHAMDVPYTTPALEREHQSDNLLAAMLRFGKMVPGLNASGAMGIPCITSGSEREHQSDNPLATMLEFEKGLTGLDGSAAMGVPSTTSALERHRDDRRAAKLEFDKAEAEHHMLQEKLLQMMERQARQELTPEESEAKDALLRRCDECIDVMAAIADATLERTKGTAASPEASGGVAAESEHEETERETESEDEPRGEVDEGKGGYKRSRSGCLCL